MAENRELNRENGKFCSLNCAASYGNGLRKTTKSPNFVCVYCGVEFYRKPSQIKTRNVYCSQKCFYKATHPLYSKEQLKAIIKEFCEENGRIPLHEEFNSSPRYPKPDTYRVAFGSWNRAIEEAGFNPNGSSWGFVSLAKDGHKCHSLAEKIIDDWLTEHFINHENEVFYPDSLRRSDWKIGDIYIEYLGVSLISNHNYYKSLIEKRKLCARLNLTLLELYPEDLQNLEKKLGIFITITDMSSE
jgi:hypothetical protein